MEGNRLSDSTHTSFREGTIPAVQTKVKGEIQREHSGGAELLVPDRIAITQLPVFVTTHGTADQKEPILSR